MKRYFNSVLLFYGIMASGCAHFLWFFGMLTQSDLLTKKGVYIQQMFGSIAKVYDLLNTVLSFNFDKSWRKFAVKVSNAAPDARVLDVCTGTGDLAIAYSRVLNSSGRVIGSPFAKKDSINKIIIDSNQRILTMGHCGGQICFRRFPYFIRKHPFF